MRVFFWWGNTGLAQQILLVLTFHSRTLGSLSDEIWTVPEQKKRILSKSSRRRGRTSKIIGVIYQIVTKSKNILICWKVWNPESQGRSCIWDRKCWSINPTRRAPGSAKTKFHFIATVALFVSRAAVTRSVLFWTGNLGGSDQFVTSSDLRPLKTGRTKLISSRRETAMISVSNDVDIISILITSPHHSW